MTTLLKASSNYTMARAMKNSQDSSPTTTYRDVLQRSSTPSSDRTKLRDNVRKVVKDVVAYNQEHHKKPPANCEWHFSREEWRKAGVEPGHFSSPSSTWRSNLYKRNNVPVPPSLREWTVVASNNPVPIGRRKESGFSRPSSYMIDGEYKDHLFKSSSEDTCQIFDLQSRVAEVVDRSKKAMDFLPALIAGFPTLANIDGRETLLDYKMECLYDLHSMCALLVRLRDLPAIAYDHYFELAHIALDLGIVRCQSEQWIWSKPALNIPELRRAHALKSVLTIIHSGNESIKFTRSLLWDGFDDEDLDFMESHPESRDNYVTAAVDVATRQVKRQKRHHSDLWSRAKPTQASKKYKPKYDLAFHVDYIEMPLLGELVRQAITNNLSDDFEPLPLTNGISTPSVEIDRLIAELDFGQPDSNDDCDSLLYHKPRQQRSTARVSPIRDLATHSVPVMALAFTNANAFIPVELTNSSQSYSFWMWLSVLVCLAPIVLSIDPPSLSDFFPWISRQRRRIERCLEPVIDDIEITKTESLKFRNAMEQARAELLAYQEANMPKSVKKSESATMVSSGLLTGIELAMDSMPGCIGKHMGADNVTRISDMVNCVNMLIVGPRWSDSDSRDLKFRFIMHTALVFKKMGKVMSSNESIQKVLKPTGFSKFFKAIHHGDKFESVNQRVLAQVTASTSGCFDTNLTLDELLTTDEDRELFATELRDSEALSSSDLDILLQEYPDWITDLESYMSCGSSVFKGRTYNHLHTILTALALSPVMDAWGKVYKDVHKDEGFLLMFARGVDNLKNASDASEGLVQAVLYFIRFFYNLNRLKWNFIKVYEWMEGARDDAIWFRAERYHLMLKSGSYYDENVTLQDILEAFNAAEKKLLSEAHLYKGVVQKRIYMGHMSRVIVWKEDWKNASQGGKSKMQPFGITLYGAPGIGKTVFAEFLDKWLHHVRAIPHPKTVSVNDGDAYDTGLTSATTLIKWDDAGNVLHSKRPETITARVLRYVNSEVTTFTGAAIEEKGSKFNHSSFFLVTTNTPTLQAQYESNDPLSIWRRMGTKIECTVHPDFVLATKKKPRPPGFVKDQKDDSIDEAVVLDKDKLNPSHEGFPEHMRYRAYELTNKSTVAYTTPYMDHVEAMHYVKAQVDLHFQREEKRQQTSNCTRKINYCCHSMIPATCRKCQSASRAESESFEMLVSQALTRLQTFALHTVNDWCSETLAGPLFAFSNGCMQVGQAMKFLPAIYGFLLVAAFLQLSRKETEVCRERFLRKPACVTVENFSFRIVYSVPLFCFIIWITLKLLCYFLSLPYKGMLILQTRTWRQVDAAMAARPPTWRENKWMHWICGAGVLGFAGMLIHQSCKSSSPTSNSTSAVDKIKQLALDLNNVGMSQSKRVELSSEINNTVTEVLEAFNEARSVDNYIPVEKLAMLDSEDKMDDGTFPEPPSLVQKKEMAKSEEIQSWKKVPIGGGQAIGKAKNMTLEQARKAVFDNLVTVEVHHLNSISLINRTEGFFMQTNILVLPAHALINSENQINPSAKLVVTSYVGAAKVVHKGFIAQCYKVTGTDFIVCLFSCGRLVKDLSDLLPRFVTVDSSQIVAHFLARKPTTDSELNMSSPVHAVRKQVWSSRGGEFPSWEYSLPFDTYQGMCMSPLLRDHLGVTLEGFHLAGTKDQRTGNAGILTREMFATALMHLGQSPMYVAPTQPGPLVRKNPVSGSVMQVNDELHPHSIGMFLPDDLSYVAIADIGRGSRGGRTTMEANPYVKEALEIFGRELCYGVPKMDMNRNFRTSVILGTSAEARSVPPHLLERAFEDYVSVVPECVAKLKQEPWFNSRPLTYSEIVYGIDGHPYCSSIKVDKSAGYPFGVPKSQIMKFNEAIERHEFLPEVEQMILDTEVQILAGVQSGIPFNATLKSESRLIEKCDKARVFFADSVVRYMLVQKWLGPAMFLINKFPEKFETSIGLDRLSSGWQRHMSELLKYPERCIATDCSTYDHSQHVAVRAAATSVFVEISKHMGFTKQELICVRYVANEFLFPMINFGGYVTQGETIQPSGTNLTAHMNGIGVSLYTRCSFFKNVDFNANFRDYVSMRTLGDDMISSANESVDLEIWNAIIYAEDANEWGLTATPPEKSSIFQKCSSLYTEAYLKSKLWYNPDLSCTVGLLDPVSIFKPLEWFERSKTANFEEQHVDTLRAIANECFFYGREAHDWVISCIKEYSRVTCIPIGGAFLTSSYDQKVSDFKLRPTYTSFERPTRSPVEHPFPRFWITLVDSESEVKEGLTDFVTEEEVSPEAPPPTMLPMIVSDADAQFVDFFERPIKVGTFQLRLDQEMVTRIDPFQAIFADPNIKEKLQCWAVGKASVELTFVASKTTGHCCTMQIATMPLPRQNLFYTDDDITSPIRRLNASQRDCLYWDITAEGGARFRCNYMWQYSGSWLFAQEFSDMHSLSVEVVGAMLHVSNNEQPITVTVYARLVDFTFSGSTAVRNEGEKYSSTLSALADVASLSSKYLSFAPGLAMATDFASMALDGASGVARLFGHARPIEEGNYESVYTSPPLATMNSNLNGRMLALDRSQGLSMSGKISGSTAPDEMLFEFLLSKKNLIGVYQWSSRDPCGKRIFNLNNTCCAGVYGYGINQVSPTSGALVTANFSAAHWVNHYRITIITPKDNGGTLQLVYEPTGQVQHFSTMTNRSIIVDIGVERVIEFDCQWQQPSTLRQVHPGYFLDPFGDYYPDNMNGAFALVVENALAPFSDVDQQAWIMVESWLDPNIVLGNYAPIDLSSYILVGEAPQVSQTRSLLPVPTSVPFKVIQKGDGFFGRKQISTSEPSPSHTTTTPHVAPTMRPVARTTMPTIHSGTPTLRPSTESTMLTLKPTSRPSSREPTGTPIVEGTGAPSALPVFTGGPVYPTDAPSAAPTVVCAGHLISVPVQLFAARANAGTVIAPYFSGDVVKVPAGVSTIGVPYYSDGSSASMVKFIVINATGVSFTDGSQTSVVTTDSPSTVIFTYSKTRGYFTTSITVSDPCDVTALQVTCAGGYTWAEYGPSSLPNSTTMLDGSSLSTVTLANTPYFNVPNFPSTDTYCYASTEEAGIGGVPVIAFGSGSIRNGGTAWAVSIAPGLISAITAPGGSVAIHAGYDTPVVELHSMFAVVPAGLGRRLDSEASFGSPFIGRELIAPIHFGEQVMSLRSLWKVFKQQQYIVLDPTSIASNVKSISTRGGVIEGSLQNTMYGFRTPNLGNLNLLTLDSIIFLSYSSVRGGMVSHYTAEFGDGLIKFVRPHDETGTDILNTRRGFEQMHTAIQRSIVINWPCYIEQRFLVPRSIGYETQSGPGLFKEVILSTGAYATQPLIVREDVAIGEDFSLSYFIGAPVLQFSSGRGYSVPPLHFQNNTQETGSGTYVPAQAPDTLAPTSTQMPGITSAPTSLGTQAPTTLFQSEFYNGPSLSTPVGPTGSTSAPTIGTARRQLKDDTPKSFFSFL